MSRFLLAGLFWISIASQGFSQDRVPVSLNEMEQQYANALSMLLDLWEKKEISFERGPFDAEFSNRLGAFRERQSTDRVDRAISADFIAENAGLLPERVSSDLQLTAGARLSLLASIVDATPRLQEMGIAPTPDALREGLPFSLYATLGAAQEDAKLNGQSQIYATNVKRAGVYFFSLGWPFCCAVP